MLATKPRTIETPDPTTHLAMLDGLRGVAIFGVVVCHVADTWSQGSGLYLPLANLM